MQKQIFVWDLDDEQMAIINPEIVESSGEWVYDEGCLSIPGLYVEMLRPNKVLIRGLDSRRRRDRDRGRRAEGRLFQHEIDHLHGVLMFDRMTPEQRKAAMAEYRRVQEMPAAEAPKRRLQRSDAAPSSRAAGVLGTPEMAVPPLRALVAAGFEVAWSSLASTSDGVAVRELLAEPGEGRGDRARHPGVTTRSTTLWRIGAELGVVVAFGQLIKPHVLEQLPMVNLHFSLLPRWRGAAPVERGAPRRRRL